MTTMDHDTFVNLPTSEIAKILQAQGSKACVFPINGTRRWYMLEHGQETHPNPMEDYIEITGKRHIETYKLIFEHGLDTLITPIFGGEILNRGEDYMDRIAAAGMARLATNTDFLSFYEKYDVRVRFYGDYHKQFTGTPYAHLPDLFDRISKHTAHHQRYRLFYGVFANDATEWIAEMSVRFFQAHNRLPARRDLIELYYGEYIEKADIFIGFEKFNVFDYPMLGWGEESLYFTVAPSLYISDRQLREILYDYIYLRPVQDPDYTEMPMQDFGAMRQFYNANRETAFGVGEIRGGIWYPKSGVKE
ncbi:MAG: diterpene synthase [Chloroflexi bacterium]|nr:MAG: diterpene synthase [Chloroflexota bacterium]